MCEKWIILRFRAVYVWYESFLPSSHTRTEQQVLPVFVQFRIHIGAGSHYAVFLCSKIASFIAHWVKQLILNRMIHNHAISLRNKNSNHLIKNRSTSCRSMPRLNPNPYGVCVCVCVRARTRAPTQCAKSGHCACSTHAKCGPSTKSGHTRGPLLVLTSDSDSPSLKTQELNKIMAVAWVRYWH